MFTLMNNEFAFDVDLSTVECGLNAALYFVAMDEVSREHTLHPRHSRICTDAFQDGGMSKQTNNKAGAKYGVGYCDAQCARDLKFVGGKVKTPIMLFSSRVRPMT